MIKKILIIVFAALVLCAGITILSLAIKNSSNEKELYSTYYSLDEDFIIEAANGSMNQEKNTVEFIKTAFNSGANCVELDLTFDPSGVPYIESDPYNIKDGTLKLEQVMLMMKNEAPYKHCFIDLKVNGTENLSLIDELCEKYEMTDRVFYSGINLNQSSLVRELSSVPFYLTMEIHKSENNDYLTEAFNDISNSGAIGVECELDDMSPLFSDILKENWIKISFENVNSKNDCVKALLMSPGRIKTDKPYEVLEIVQNWQNNAPVEFYGIETTAESK